MRLQLFRKSEDKRLHHGREEWLQDKKFAQVVSAGRDPNELIRLDYYLKHCIKIDRDKYGFV